MKRKHRQKYKAVVKSGEVDPEEAEIRLEKAFDIIFDALQQEKERQN